MGRKKRSHTPMPAPKPQREDAFHSPFHHLKEQLRGTSPPAPANGMRSGHSEPLLPKSSSTPRPAPRPTLSPEARAKRERALFLAEMADVTPLPPDPHGRVAKRPRPASRLTPLSDAFDGLDELRDLVDGRGVFHIQYTDEYMEGIAPGVDQRLAQRLHRGDYAVQAHCDLHGHTVEEAHAIVTRFLSRAYATGQRCVLLIHGRGRNSRDNRPVLKEQVQRWLSHGRLSRMVLAFATAPSTDGGAGAVCVLLRRTPHLRKK